MVEVIKSPVIIIILLVAVAIIFFFLIKMLFGWDCGIGCRACELVSDQVRKVALGQTVGGLISPFHPVCRLIPV